MPHHGFLVLEANGGTVAELIAMVVDGCEETAVFEVDS